MREAENGGDFVRVVRDETGIELTVIRGEEEARLIYLGARAALNLAGRKALIIDIGGGSVELIVGDAREAHYATSLKLGVLRLLDLYPLVRSDHRRSARAASPSSSIAQLEAPTAADPQDRLRPRRHDLGHRARRRRADPADVDRQAALASPSRTSGRSRRSCARSTAAERSRVPGLDPKRVDSIVPGVILVRSLLEVVHADSYVLCETALREGLVADYAARNRPGIQLIDEYPDLRRRIVVRLSRRCNANQPHAEHVARLALDLFRGTRPLHGLPNADGELLEFAALLHDIGFHVAPSKHHKHAAYLIENADLQGFTADEIQTLAQVGALSPQGDAQREPSRLRGAAGRGQAEGARAGRHPAPRRRARPRLRAAGARASVVASATNRSK